MKYNSMKYNSSMYNDIMIDMEHIVIAIVIHSKNIYIYT